MSRIYVVEVDSDESREYHLVNATTKAQAVHHVMQGRTRARVAKQTELVKLLGEGVPVEHADCVVADEASQDPIPAPCGGLVPA